MARGTTVKGDTFDVDGSSAGPSTAVVVHEDPKTHEFTYVGTDNSGDWTQF